MKNIDTEALIGLAVGLGTALVLAMVLLGAK